MITPVTVPSDLAALRRQKGISLGHIADSTKSAFATSKPSSEASFPSCLEAFTT